MVAPINVSSELASLGQELRSQGDGILVAIAQHDDVSVAKIVKRREGLIERVRFLAARHPQEVASCREILDAAWQESKIVAAARARQEEIRQELGVVSQRIALREAYSV